MNSAPPIVVVTADDLAHLLGTVVRREVRAVVDESPSPAPEAPPSRTEATLPPFATADEVGSLVNFTPRTLRRLVLAKRFPEPVRLGKRAIRWRREDVFGWLAREGAK